MFTRQQSLSLSASEKFKVLENEFYSSKAELEKEKKEGEANYYEASNDILSQCNRLAQLIEQTPAHTTGPVTPHTMKSLLRKMAKKAFQYYRIHQGARCDWDIYPCVDSRYHDDGVCDICKGTYSEIEAYLKMAPKKSPVVSSI